jgi:hypothetical protein
VKRTDKQNRSLHKWFEQVANEMNERGMTVEMVLSTYKVQIDWNKTRFKELVWRPVQEALTNKASSTEPETNEYIEIYDHINRWLSEQGVHIPWPDRFSQMGE